MMIKMSHGRWILAILTVLCIIYLLPPIAYAADGGRAHGGDQNAAWDSADLCQLKKIRADDGAWQGLEEYISHHTDAEFSHGIRVDCVAELYPELHRQQQIKPAN